MIEILIYLQTSRIIVLLVAVFVSLLVIGFIHWLALRNIPVEEFFEKIFGDSMEKSDVPIKSGAVMFSMIGFYASFVITMTTTTMVGIIDFFVQDESISPNLGAAWIFTALFTVILGGGLFFYYIETSEDESESVERAREDLNRV